MPAEGSDPLARAAEAVSDGTPIDWEQEMKARPDLSGELERLSVLERVRGVFAAPLEPGVAEPGAAVAGGEPLSRRSTVKTPTADNPVLFTWGHLQVLELLDQGGSADVYRAYDPTLDTEIALKLRKESDPWPAETTKRFLNEARRLARVRHPNVVRVYGADCHDGRVGIWTELVRGRSLEEYLRREGPIGAREAALIGQDLCRALAAVHAANKVHRDVKTLNVMKEEGGRIVLTDFGSMADLDLSPATEQVEGTLICMAPEQLRGRTAGPQADIYGLGVLLYRLVTRRYPVEAETREELERKHAQREWVPLRDRRADLPLDFIQVVERALSHDPRERYRSGSAMERALASVIGTVQVHEREHRWGIRHWITVAAVPVIAAIVIAIVTAHKEQATPNLMATASLYRRVGQTDEPLASEARIAPGDQLSLLLEGSEPMHAYVLNEDDHGDAFVLFPLPGMEPTNPLQPGLRHRLPGQMGDSLVYWNVTSPGERERVIVIAARKPLEEMESVIAGLPRAEPGRAVQYGKIPAETLGRLRGIGGVKAEGTVEEESSRRLEVTVQALSKRAKEVGDIWLWVASLRNPAQTP